MPKETDNTITHIRPKAKNTEDKTALLDGQIITKQYFWLNNAYVLEILNSKL